MRIILFTIFLFTNIFAFSQEDLINDVRGKTICIGFVVSKLDSSKIIHRFFSPIGTGVLFYVKTANTVVPCIVTAKHVVYNPNENWSPDTINIRFSSEDTLGFDEYTGIRVILKDDRYIYWIPHPDPKVDLVCIPLLNNFIDAPKNETLHTLGYQDIASSNEIYDGESIMVLGYPGFATSKILVRSVLRQGIISWTNPRNPVANTFLIDCNIFPGNSGSPVFTMPFGLGPNNTLLLGGKIKFAGIVTEVYYEQQHATDSTTLNDIRNFQGRQIFVQQKTALGVVEPAQRIKELLDFVNTIFKKQSY
jgi:hypothetical protein